MAGYSTRTLVDKLGIKPGIRAAILDAPDGYDATLGVRVPSRLAKNLDFIQCFARTQAALRKRFCCLGKALAPHGMLWISWPKGSSGVATDLNENIVREIGLKEGLVDVKVCAIDNVWSGLKFVFRLKDRKDSSG